MKKFDIIVLGGGIAGCTAAIYALRSGAKVCIMDDKAGGQTERAALIENYPGFVKIKGYELMERILEQVKINGGVFVGEKCFEIEKKGNGFLINGKYFGKAVVLAIGCKRRKLGLENEEKYYGRGLSYCAVCDGPAFAGKKVVVIGGGNSGITNALYLSGFCKKVVVLEGSNKLNCSAVYKNQIKKRNIEVVLNCRVLAISGKNKVESILIENKGRKSKIKTDGVFVYVGFVPNKEFCKKLKIKTDKKGFIIVDEKMQTNRKGFFACGDDTGNFMQSIWAAAEGAKAGYYATEYAKRKSNRI